MKRLPRAARLPFRYAHLAAALIAVAQAWLGIAATQALAQSLGTPGGPAPRVNPAPALAYELLVDFKDVPGPLRDLIAFALFEVGNDTCIPVDHARAIGGVKLRPQHQLGLKLTALTDRSYQTIVFADALSSSDLFGLGMCHWELQGMTVNFRSPATLFVGGAALEQLRTATTIVQHYLVRDYFEKPPVGVHVFGEKADHYRSSMGAQFTLTITPRLVTPPR